MEHSIKLISFEGMYGDIHTRLSKPALVHDEGSVGSRESLTQIHRKYERCDYGFVSTYLQAGLSVSIRPATADELKAILKRTH